MPTVKMENSRQKEELLGQLKKIMAELLYLGASIEEIRDAPDGLHPNSSGYQVVTNRIGKSIENLFNMD